MTDRDRSLRTIYKLGPSQTYQWVAAKTPGFVRMHFIGVTHPSPIGFCRTDLPECPLQGLAEALGHYWPTGEGA
jgi:hypothetical protein